MNFIHRAPRKAFADTLIRLMDERRLLASDLALRMRDALKGEKFNAVNLAHYRAGRSLPRPRYLFALSRALDVPVDLLTRAKNDQLTGDSKGRDAASEKPALRIEQLEDGSALFQLNQRLPWPTVLEVMAALKDCAIIEDHIVEAESARQIKQDKSKASLPEKSERRLSRA